MLYLYLRRQSLHRVVDLEELFCFEVKHIGYDIGWDLLNTVIIIPHVAVEEAPRPLYAILRIHQLMLQFEKVFACFQIGIVLGNGQQLPQAAYECVLIPGL